MQPLSDVDIRPLSLRPMARIRLLCIPFAGAGPAAFRAFSAALPGEIEPWGLMLPGREGLAKAAPFVAWAGMLDASMRAAAAIPPGPLAIYGHSLGALIGLDLAARIAQTSVSRLVHLFVAARPAPAAATETAAILDRDDETLLARMTEIYGAPPASFLNAEIRDYALPILRADLALLLARPPTGPAGLNAPLTAIIGAGDPSTPAAAIDGWRAETSGPFAIETVAAGHYFLDRAEAAAIVARRLLA
jgi:medium-chain acyl-[acyl-carrier-protein] hydrolase